MTNPAPDSFNCSLDGKSFLSVCVLSLSEHLMADWTQQEVTRREAASCLRDLKTGLKNRGRSIESIWLTEQTAPGSNLMTALWSLWSLALLLPVIELWAKKVLALHSLLCWREGVIHWSSLRQDLHSISANTEENCSVWLLGCDARTQMPFLVSKQGGTDNGRLSYDAAPEFTITASSQNITSEGFISAHDGWQPDNWRSGLWHVGILWTHAAHKRKKQIKPSGRERIRTMPCSYTSV